MGRHDEATPVGRCFARGGTMFLDPACHSPVIATPLPQS